MRKLTLGLGLGALLALVMATSAYAVSTEATWTSSSTGSTAGGSKAAPAPFSGQWTIKATNNINPSYRAAVPFFGPFVILNASLSLTAIGPEPVVAGEVLPIGVEPRHPCP